MEYSFLLLSHLILSYFLILFSSHFLFLQSNSANPLSPLLPISTSHSYLPTPHQTPHSPFSPFSSPHNHHALYTTPHFFAPLLFTKLSIPFSSHHITLVLPSHLHRLEVSLDRLANRLEAMAVHHEQQFASAVDNIGDIEVIYIHPFYCCCLVLLSLFFSCSCSYFIVVFIIILIGAEFS